MGGEVDAVRAWSGGDRGMRSIHCRFECWHGRRTKSNSKACEQHTACARWSHAAPNLRQGLSAAVVRLSTLVGPRQLHAADLEGFDGTECGRVLLWPNAGHARRASRCASRRG